MPINGRERSFALGGLATAGFLMLASCSVKSRDFSGGPAEAASSDEQRGEGQDASTVARTAPENEESPLPIVDSDAGGASSDEDLAIVCDGVSGSCAPSAEAGNTMSACVTALPRNCSSDLDNNCDGLADNLADEICQCVPGSVEACDEHPGLDGNGGCRAGSRTCIAGEGNVTSVWGPCEGAVGPEDADTCAIPGDDGDCDGIPNEGCSCVDGQTQPCGATTDNGSCEIGISTCVDGAFGACQGAVGPALRDTCVLGDDSNCTGVANEGCACIDGQTRACGPDTDLGVCQRGSQTCAGGVFGPCEGATFATRRNCGSPLDNDCDGRPDNTIDAVCQCAPGQGNAQCSGNPNASRCTPQGQCAPCQSNVDCSLVSGGRNTCENGQCVQATLGLGVSCGSDEQCESGQCDAHFVDADGDGLAPGGAAIVRFCANPTFTRQGFTKTPPTGTSTTDCFDGNSDVFPGQTRFFPQPAGAHGFDYDCNGVEEREARRIVDDGVCSTDTPPCDAGGIILNVGCGESMIATFCVQNSASTCGLRVGDSIGLRGCR